MPNSDFIVFVDESGDHSLDSINPEWPVFVLCFCIFPIESYASQITSKIRKLKFDTFGHDLVVLHEHDIVKRKGYFSNMNKPARDAFMGSLSQIISDADMTIISVVIDKKKHKEKYTTPGHPYHLAMQFGLERIYDFLRIKEQHESTIHVVFEARGSKEDLSLELEFRRVCDGNNRNNKNYPMRIVIADKKTNSEGLQLADLTARPIGLSVLRPHQPNRAFEIIKTKLFTGRYDCIMGNGLKIFP